VAVAIIGTAPDREAWAQTIARAGDAGAPVRSDAPTQDARLTREAFLNVLQRFPPAVGQVLRLDPSLLTNPAYLASYPALGAFLAQHPEVARNPSYYLASIRDVLGPTLVGLDPGAGESRVWQAMFENISVTVVLAMVISGVVWLIRTLLDYRRWNRQAKVQAEAHAKLLDRFTSNNDLLAYVQSPSGSQFLQSAPISLDVGGRRMDAPVGRILWSVQVGVVLAMAGAAMEFVSGRVEQQAQQPIYVVGVLGLAVGIGFILSAGVAYGLSRRLGLLEPAAPGPIHPGSSAS
jgi:hypothetical protein